MKMAVVLFIVALGGCLQQTSWDDITSADSGVNEGADVNASCYHNHYQDFDRYEVATTETTPSGIGVDATGQAVDVRKVDQLSDELESCLRASFAANPSITMDTAVKAGCRENGGGFITALDPFIAVKRECIKVKFPDDWFWSTCTGEQLLPISAPMELCEAKGLAVTLECPCFWRVATQDDNIIIVPPGLGLFKAELARIATGCNNPYKVPQIAHCL